MISGNLWNSRAPVASPWGATCAKFSVTGLLLGLVLACSGVVQAADYQPEVLVELERTRAYEGEPVRYQVTLNHVENPTPPDLSYLDSQFQVSLTGERPMNSSFVRIINGQRSETIRRGTAYIYTLIPKATGLLTIPGPKVEINGQTIEGRNLMLEVLPADQQDTVKMRLSVEPESVYPTQPFTVTLSVTIKALPEPYASRDPLGVQSKPPVLSIPWATDDSLPEGLEPSENAQRWLTSLHNRDDGFSINRLRSSSLMSFFESNLLTFKPSPRRVTLADAAGKETDYWVYDFKRTFVPSRIGDYSFGPVTLQGQFATDARDGQMVGEAIHAAAAPVEVTIKQVPDQGRTGHYCGAIGRFDSLTATLTPTEVRVGDPMTLTLTLTGSGSLDNLTVPDLSKMPQIAKHFKTYEGTLETKGSTAKFVYTLRPLDEEIQEFPPVAISYFDVKTDHYNTLESQPVPIKVDKAEKLSDSQIVGAAAGPRRNGHELEISREGIFANKTDANLAYDQRVRVKYWAAALGLLGVGYVAIFLTTRRLRTWLDDQPRSRRRTAVSRARHRLHHGSELLKHQKMQEGADEIRLAVCGLIADLDDTCESGMTTTDACRKLEDFGLESELVKRIGRTLETCDATRYAGSAAAVGLADEADELLDEMVDSLKKRKFFK